MFGRFLKKTKNCDSDGAPAETVLARLDSINHAFFQVTGPEDGSCVCNDWVGAVISIDGLSPSHPSLAESIADGLFHPGCRHGLRMFNDANPSDQAQAQFRTQLALDAFWKREDAQDPGGKDRFTRLYGWARRVDKAGGPIVAVVLCQAALAMLREGNIFGESQADLERILRARIATIRAKSSEENQ